MGINFISRMRYFYVYILMFMNCTNGCKTSKLASNYALCLEINYIKNNT
jgi:hypothetical protein